MAGAICYLENVPMEKIFETMNELNLEHDWYQQPLPVKVMLDSLSFEIVQVLRFFPGKRLTCLADIDGKLRVLKCFASHDSCRQEKAMHERMRGLGLNVPALIESKESDYAWLAFEYVPNALAWEAMNESQQIRSLEYIVEALASLHEAGLYHRDPHLDNFLLLEDSVVLVDAASVIARGHRSTLWNLAHFLSQVYPHIKSSWHYFGTHYARCRNRDLGKIETYFLHSYIRINHKRRACRFLKKIFRTCSEFYSMRGPGFIQMSRRELAWHDDLHPESLPVVKTLKAGNTATVWLAELDGQWVVVKRYNTKDRVGGFKQWFKSSRARISWCNAHLLKFLEIPTPKPLMYRDERHGLFSQTSYFVTEYIEGMPCHLYIESSGISEPLLLSLKELFDCMRWFYLCQTDLKASNIIIHNEQEPYLIDMDSVVHYSFSWSFNRRWKKAWQRWLANWQGNNRVIFEQSI